MIFSYFEENLIRMMNSVVQENLVNPDQQGPLDQRERAELPGQVALLEQLAYQATLEQLEQQELLGQQEQMVPLEIQGQREVQGQPGHLEPLEQQEQRAQLA